LVCLRAQLKVRRDSSPKAQLGPAPNVRQISHTARIFGGSRRHTPFSAVLQTFGGYLASGVRFGLFSARVV
jgi:hypothetical protein